jgi:hypothetical protein
MIEHERLAPPTRRPPSRWCQAPRGRGGQAARDGRLLVELTIYSVAGRRP